MARRRFATLTLLVIPAFLLAALTLSTRFPLARPSLLPLYAKPTLFELGPPPSDLLQPGSAPTLLFEITPVFYADALERTQPILARADHNLSAQIVEEVVDWLVQNGVIYAQGVVTFVEVKERHVEQSEDLTTIVDRGLEITHTDAFPFPTYYNEILLRFAYRPADGTISLSAERP